MIDARTRHFSQQACQGAQHALLPVSGFYAVRGVYMMANRAARYG